MADNNIGKPLTMVEKVTEPNANTNVIINDNGNVHQVAVNDLLKNSDVNTSLNEVRNTNRLNILKPIGSDGQSSVTYTENTDGSILAKGTASANSYHSYIVANTDTGYLKKGVKYSVGFVGTATNVTFQILYYNQSNQAIELLATKTHGSFIIPSNAKGLLVRLYVQNGTVVNETVKPMLVVGDYDFTEYEEYSPNTREIKNTLDIIKYKIGDTISIKNLITSGFITGTSKDIMFQFHVGKYIDGNNIQVNSLKVCVRNTNGIYTIPNDTDVTDKISTIGINNGLIHIILTNSEGWNATNNTPVSIYITSGSFLVK